MENYTIEDLNQAAMQIILHAGDCRKVLNDALNAVYEDDMAGAEKKLKIAKAEITEAHRLQTAMIQGTIMDENQPTSLLFTHAQDTLMTINSELLLVKHMIKLYKKLEDKING
ncbi:PTS lactose/cellobiose transporter subunit IIA [Dielma fastidiosa]|uniref:PTS lactose/cellobiose transporter subunit IIA n=1 Tax=Dielma fastidiosa TaxID=1034346 RepID=A0AB35UTB3_9FIRM|nr:PTS lactose/cellobiose transporter subunit IIA [Dielma fastidiosa]MDY5169167.1 PTS lactose/cellobiose transporter subunit IIA [Dielma fastidiosa]